MEWHDSTKEDWPINFTAPLNGTFDIPLGCLHIVDTENLFCGGRCADSDRAASSVTRVMGTALATVQAAGVAASLTGSNGTEPVASEVQQILLQQGVLLDKTTLPQTVVV